MKKKILNILNPEQKEENEILKLISESTICSPMNTLKFENGRAYLNPNNQRCFNSGSYTVQDYRDWLNGKGNIVKGNDEEEKTLVWEYAKFCDEYYFSYMITLNYNFFHLVSTDYRDNYNQDAYGFNNYSNRPFTPFVYDGTNKAEFISNIFGNFVISVKSELNGTYNNNGIDRVYREYQMNSWGIKKTLLLMGIGYSGATNTPEEIENLTWFSDVVFAKAYYLHLKDKGVKFPNFDFIENNRYKL